MKTFGYKTSFVIILSVYLSACTPMQSALVDQGLNKTKSQNDTIWAPLPDSGHGGGGSNNEDTQPGTPWTLPAVSESDVTLDPVPQMGTIYGNITGYEMNTSCPFPVENCDVPLFEPYDRNQADWWDNLVEELLFSRGHVVLAHGRGCYDPNNGDDGNGNMCPRLLRHLVSAIDRANARHVMKLAMWDDTGAYQGTRNIVKGLAEGTRFDLSNTNEALEFFWDRNMRIWFDTIPKDLWYLHNGRPVVAFWSLSDYFFSNQRNNARVLLNALKDRFRSRYGMDPLFILDSTWTQLDPTISAQEAYGVNSWFNPLVSNYTYTWWNNSRWGAIVPSFKDFNFRDGCGTSCREIQRGSWGQSFRNALNAGRDAEFTLLEGHTNVAESAGFYRSNKWETPNLYLNIIREYSDPLTQSLRFQAEASDSFNDATPNTNQGGAYRFDGLDVGKLSGPKGGWFVGWTQAGEWIEYKQIHLSSGLYRVSVRVASGVNTNKISLVLNGKVVNSVSFPSTGGYGSYKVISLGDHSLAHARHDIKIVVDQGNPNIDWFFFKKK